MFKQPRWIAMENNIEELVQMIDNDLFEVVSSCLESLKEEEKPDKADVSVVTKMVKSLANISFKTKLIEQLQSLYKCNAKTWLSQLNANDYLIGLEDCVFDFKHGCFREGLPEDMVTMSTGHTREDVEMGADLEDLIMHSLGEMHESPEVFDYVLNVLATSVVGARPVDRFSIWTGTCANGKGLTKNLCATALGEYYYEPSATVFSDRAVSSSCLSSELAKLRSKRLCITSEAEPGAKLRAGLLKQCSGHDLVQARDMWQSAGEFRCNANIVLCFNEVPGVDDSSGGIARRLEMVRFSFKFVDRPAQTHEKKINTDLQEKFSSIKFGACFLGILIRRFQDNGFQFARPDCVSREAADYLCENDVLGEFLEATFIQTEDLSDKVSLKEMFRTQRGDNTYNKQLGFTVSRKLSQKLKMKNIVVQKSNGEVWVRGFKFRDFAAHSDDMYFNLLTCPMHTHQLRAPGSTAHACGICAEVVHPC